MIKIGCREEGRGGREKKRNTEVGRKTEGVGSQKMSEGSGEERRRREEL